MLAINKEKLIALINNHDGEELFENDLNNIMKEYGDEYFVEGGVLELANKGKEL